MAVGSPAYARTQLDRSQRSTVDNLCVWQYTKITVNDKERKQMDDVFDEQLKQEGYRVWAVDGKYLLIDLVGEFVDSEHDSMEALREYCEKNVFTFY